MKVLKQTELYRLIENDSEIRLIDQRCDDQRIITDSESKVRQLSDASSVDFDTIALQLFETY